MLLQPTVKIMEIIKAHKNPKGQENTKQQPGITEIKDGIRWY